MRIQLVGGAANGLGVDNVCVVLITNGKLPPGTAPTWAAAPAGLGVGATLCGAANGPHAVGHPRLGPTALAKATMVCTWGQMAGLFSWAQINLQLFATCACN